MFIVELKHYMLRYKMWLLFVLYLVIKWICLDVSDYYIDTHLLDHPEQYKSFFEQFSGKWTLEKEEALNTIDENTVISQYTAYVQEDPAHRELIEQLGAEAWIGNERFDYAAAGILIFFSVFVATNDDQSGVAVIKLNSNTRKRKFWRYGSGLVLGFSLVIACLQFIIEWGYFSIRFGLTNYDAPVQSLWSYSHCPLPLTVLQAAIVIFALRLLAFLFMGALSFQVGIWMKRLWTGFLSLGLFFILPYMLASRESIRYWLEPMGFFLGTGYLRGKSEPVLYDGVQIGSPACPVSVGECAVLGVCVLSISCGIFLFHMVNWRKLARAVRGHGRTTAVLLFTIAVTCGSAALNRCDTIDTAGASYYSGQVCYNSDYRFVQEDNQIMQIANENPNEGDEFAVNRDLFSEEITNFCMAGNYLYYYSLNQTSGLLQVNRISLLNYSVQNLYEETRGLKEFDLKTKHLGLTNVFNFNNTSLEDDIAQEVTNFWVDDGSIYIMDANEIERISVQNQKKEYLVEGLSLGTTAAYADGILYFTDSNGNLIRETVDTHKLERTGVKNCNKLCLIDGELYMADENGTVSRYQEGENEKLKLPAALPTSRMNGCDGLLYYITNEYKLVCCDVQSGVSKTYETDKKLLDVQVYPKGYVRLYVENENAEYEWIDEKFALK